MTRLKKLEAVVKAPKRRSTKDSESLLECREESVVGSARAMEIWPSNGKRSFAPT
ncbi:MAG: hypothetical protein IPJ24_04020 [bacterium]|nr:hypothetical protein [bacterium]